MEKKQVYDILCGIFDYYTVTDTEMLEFNFTKDDQIKQIIVHSNLLGSFILNNILHENHCGEYILDKVGLIKYLNSWFNNQNNVDFLLQGVEVLIPVYREMLIDGVLN